MALVTPINHRKCIILVKFSANLLEIGIEQTLVNVGFNPGSNAKSRRL